MSAARPAARVLLLSHSGEPFCTRRVAEAIARRGGTPERLDTDLFPGSLRLQAALDEGGCHLLRGDEVLRVDAVWLWRLWPAALDERLSAAHREAGQREAAAALTGFLDLLGDVPWLDPLDRVRAAENKTRQLRIARAVGLSIPPTLITADGETARRFHEQHGGRVIAKMQTSLAFSMSGQGGLPTRLLRAQDLASLDDLRHCPMVLQRYVEKARELRVMWVEGEAFVGALDGARCGVDWRYESTADWEHATLPVAVLDGLSRLMAGLGLGLGAIDLIETPDGEHVFLEVNPLGEWGMLERDLGLPISDALARALLRRAGARE